MADEDIVRRMNYLKTGTLGPPTPQAVAPMPAQTAAAYGPEVLGGGTFSAPFGGGTPYQQMATPQPWVPSGAPAADVVTDPSGGVMTRPAAVPEARIALSSAPRMTFSQQPLAEMADASTVPPAPTFGAPGQFGFNPATYDQNMAIAKMKADYAAMRAGERQDTDTALANRDASIKQNIAYANANDPRRQFDANVRNAYVDARLAQGMRRPGGMRAGLTQAAAASPMFGQQQPAHAPRNYLGEAAQAQGLVTGAAQGVQAEAAGRMGMQGQQMGLQSQQIALESQQRINTLAQKLPYATGKQAQEISTQLATLMGGKPGEWHPTVIAGRKYTDPGTQQQVSEPGSVLLHNTRTGEKMIVGGSEAGAPAGPKPPREQWLKEARIAPQNKDVSLAELEAFYDKQYGK